jgi:uncharacterized protein (AIM24 family)
MDSKENESMQNPPTLLPTNIPDGAAPGVKYQVSGELVPMLHVRLDGTTPVFFEHHVVLWKDPELDIVMHPLKGAFKRMVAGMPIFMTEAKGPGEIAFSRDGAGHVFPIHLSTGSAIEVREHQFIAATGNLDYTFRRLKGISNMLFGGSGIFIDRFSAANGEGVVWLHGYGNVYEKTLQPGEQIDIEPGGWIYRDDTVQMEIKMFGLKTGFLGGGGNLIWNRFTGPGRVGIQSMYFHMPTSE